METPVFLPQSTGIKKTSESVSERRTFHAQNLYNKCETPVFPKHNRLKRTETHKGLENSTDCGNCFIHVNEITESSGSCNVCVITCKGNLFADAGVTTDGEDNSVSLPMSPYLLTESIRKDGRHSQTEQNVSQMQNGVSTKGSLKRNKLTLKRLSSNMQFTSIPAKRERGSSYSSSKPDIDHFAADKEVMSSCLRVNTSVGGCLMDLPEVNIVKMTESSKPRDVGQALTPITPRTQRVCRDPTNVKILREMISGWRNEFSNEISREFLEEIQMLNLQFPLHRFLTLLLRKRTAPEEENSALEGENVQRKRKQELQEQMCDRTFKSHRTKSNKDNKLDFEPFSESLAHSHTKYRNRLSRTKRRRQQQATCCAAVTESMGNESVHQDPWPSCLQRLDVLWTDKYNPQQSNEVIGNSASVGKLHSWLNEWKIRADIEEKRRRQEERRIKKETRSEESWDCGDFEGDPVSIDYEKELCNTVLLIGPSGVGKTAAVYACAQELGFKVFEVNSSVLRCGRLILSQLTEATQSHQVDIHRIKTLKPEIVNQSKIKPASPCDKADRKATSSSKETSSSSSVSCLSVKPQPVKLTHFFKSSSKTTVCKTSDGPDCYIRGRLRSSGSGLKGKRQGNKELTCSSKDPSSVGQSQTIPMSLILFEEVDIIFTEDVGFLAAVRTFMSTSKRPIILATNDPLFGERLKGHFDELHFQTPSLQTIRSYLQCLCVVENMRTDPEDMAFLLCQNKGDIRQSILQLQLWVCSGGGRTEQQILKNTLKYGSWTELENSRCLEILAEKKGEDLLYSNIERLFSPHFTYQSSHQQESINPKPKGEKPVKGLMLQSSANVHEVKPERLSTCRGKKRLSSNESKNISYCHSDLTLFSVHSKQTNHLPSETDVYGQDKSPMLVFQHLVCIAKFFDNMSFMDAYLQRPFLNGTGYCNPESLGWIGATVKDSLLDLPREEQTGQCFENSSQMLAIVQGLGFLQCQTELSGIWTEAARLRENMSSERWEQIICTLSLPSDKKPLKLCHCKFCAPSVVQKRKEILSILISSKQICHSNKSALSMDYLPIMRSICRSERDKEPHSFRRSHYLSSFHLPRSTLELMALDFP